MPNRPTPEPSLTIRLRSETETSALGQAIAPLLTVGDTLLLDGPIGAGKTHLARTIIQHRLSIPEEVPSPSFTLVQSYDANGTEIWHADLYRLTQPDEVWELGLDDAFQSAICLVEWPDRLGAHRPPTALDIRLSYNGDGRLATITGGRQGLLQAISKAYSDG